MTVSIIAAISENHVLGKDNKLVWSMPADFEYYKNTVRHKTIIMGRKTAESPDMFFSQKRNILITRKQGFALEGFETAHSLSEAIRMCDGEKEVFITGGSEIYRQALAVADLLYLTIIHQIFDGDAFFPNFSEDDWVLLSKNAYQADAENPYDYSFYIWGRKKTGNQ